MDELNWLVLSYRLHALINYNFNNKKIKKIKEEKNSSFINIKTK